MSDLVKRDQAAIAKTEDAMKMLVNVARTQNSIKAVASTPPIIKPEILDVELVEEEDYYEPRKIDQSHPRKEIVVQTQATPVPYAEPVQQREIPQQPKKPRYTRDFVILGMQLVERAIEEGKYSPTLVTEKNLVDAAYEVANGDRTRAQLSEELYSLMSEYKKYYIQFGIDDYLRFMDDFKA